MTAIGARRSSKDSSSNNRKVALVIAAAKISNRILAIMLINIKTFKKLKNFTTPYVISTVAINYSAKLVVAI